jgi:hypothetical protein
VIEALHQRQRQLFVSRGQVPIHKRSPFPTVPG